MTDNSPAPWSDATDDTLDTLRRDELAGRVLDTIREYQDGFMAALVQSYTDGTLTAAEAAYMARLWRRVVRLG